MRKQLFLISLLLATAFPALFSQTLQVGMRLEYYSYPFPFSPPYFGIDTISLTIAGDTVIQGATWLQLQGELEPCFFDDPVLIREEGPRVYHFTEGAERLLYDYSLNPGDSLWQSYVRWNPNTNNYELYTSPLVIGDTLSVWAGGAWRKMQYIDWFASPYPWLDMGGEILEGFGSTFYFFPRNGICEQNLCLRAIYWPNGDVEMVETLSDCFVISSVQGPEAGMEVRVWPNPVQDVLHLRTSQSLPADAQVTVYDLHGRTVYHGTFAEAEKGIAAQSWPKGLYWIVVRANGIRGGLRMVKF